MMRETFHRDVEGRPLREIRTPPEHLRPGDIEHRRCPYRGARHGLPINASALRQTAAHWDEILDVLGGLRAAYVAVRGAPACDVLDVWRTSQLASAVPWWFVLRGEPVPAYAAALAKAAQGIGILAQRLYARTLVERWSAPRLTPRVLLELAVETGALVGEREACAGSDKMLVRCFEVIAGDGGRPCDPRLLAFGAHYLALKQSLWLQYLARRFLYAELGADDELAAPVEPSDFFIVEPPDLAYVPRLARAGWIAMLARAIVPLLPGGGDAAYAALAGHVAIVLGTTCAPADALARLAELRAETLCRGDLGLRGALDV
ncbi:MAG: hypothetical protein ACM31C_15680 [Acidobacteriota bacterium]